MHDSSIYTKHYWRGRDFYITNQTFKRKLKQIQMGKNFINYKAITGKHLTQEWYCIRTYQINYEMHNNKTDLLLN